MAKPKSRRLPIYVALDIPNLKKSLRIVEQIGKHVKGFKIHALLDQEGPKCIKALKEAGAREIWADQKVYDTRDTVKKRVQILHDHGADIITVHAAGEIEMMMAAKESGATIFAITELTSLAPPLIELRAGKTPDASVLYLARLAKLAGVDGVVCSAQEVGMLSQRPELTGLRFITPGVRLAGEETHDQKRVDTPENAVLNGATDLVVGRPITEASDPREAVLRFSNEITVAQTELKKTD